MIPRRFRTIFKCESKRIFCQKVCYKSENALFGTNAQNAFKRKNATFFRKRNPASHIAKYIAKYVACDIVYAHNLFYTQKEFSRQSGKTRSFSRKRKIVFELENMRLLSENFFFFSFSRLFFARLIADGAAGFASRLASASAFAASDDGFLCCNGYGFDSFHDLASVFRNTSKGAQEFSGIII